MRYIEFLTTKKYERECCQKFGEDKWTEMLMRDVKESLDCIENGSDLKKKALFIYTPGGPRPEECEKIRPWEEGRDEVLLPMQFLISNN